MVYTVNQYGIASKQVFLNSAQANAYGGDPSYKSYCYFYFNEPILQLPQAYNFLLSVNTAEIPVSWYRINSSNNIFSFTVNGQTLSITLRPGNYNAFQIADMLRIPDNGTFQLYTTYDSTTNKMFFSFYFHGINNLVYMTNNLSYCGLSGATVQANSGTKYYVVLVSDSVVDCMGSNSLFIRMNNVHISSFDTNHKVSTNIIARIPIDKGPNDVITYNLNNNFQAKLNIRNLSQFEILITFDDNTPVNFNGADWTMTLQVDVVKATPDYEPDKNFPEELRKAIVNETYEEF